MALQIRGPEVSKVTVKSFVISYRKKCLSYNYLPTKYNSFLICYIIRDFKGLKDQMFDLLYLKNKIYFKMQYRRGYAWNNFLNNMLPMKLGPYMEIKGLPLKHIFLDMSRMVQNSREFSNICWRKCVWNYVSFHLTSRKRGMLDYFAVATGHWT